MAKTVLRLSYHKSEQLSRNDSLWGGHSQRRSVLSRTEQVPAIARDVEEYRHPSIRFAAGRSHEPHSYRFEAV